MDQHKHKRRKTLPPTTSRLETVVNVESSDLEDGVLFERNSSKRPIIQSNLNDSDDEPSKHKSNARSKGKNKARFELDLDSSAVVSGLRSDNESTEGSDGEETMGSGSRTAVAGPSTMKPAKVKVENEEQVTYTLDKRVLGSCALKKMLSMTSLSKAQDAAKLVPQFDENNQPKHFVNNILIPHPDRDYKQEWDAWGKSLIKIMRESSQLNPDEQEVMNAATDKDIREAVRVGVWGTMKRAYDQSKKGDVETWLNQRRTSSRVSWHRSQKSERRLKSLQSSTLHVASFKFVGDPAFQSDEEDDPKAANHRFVHVPEYWTEDCNQLIEALDYSFDGGKKNQKRAKFTYSKTNIEVPVLKSGLVPQWAVRKDWAAANPELEHRSRSRIDPERASIPDIKTFNAFLHRYEPLEKRTYPDVTPNATAVTKVPEPKPTVSEAIDGAGPLVDPLSADGALSTPPRVSDPLPTPVVTTSTSDPPALLPLPASSHPSQPADPLLPGPGRNPIIAQGAYSQHTSTPPNSSQPMLVRIGDKEIWVSRVHPPPGNHAPIQAANVFFQGEDQSSKSFPLDPTLLGVSTLYHQHNDMPPPPETIVQEPESSQEQPSPSVKPRGRGRGQGGRGGRGGQGGKGEKGGRGGRGGRGVRGSRGGKRGRPQKSKEIVEDSGEDDEVENEPEGSTPPQHPVNTGNAKRISLKVRGV